MGSAAFAPTNAEDEDRPCMCGTEPGRALYPRPAGRAAQPVHARGSVSCSIEKCYENKKA
jgi:hypothetical protein